MSNPFVANIQEIPSTSAPKARPVTVEKNLDTGTPSKMHHMTIEECSSVAGGPQISNNPPT